MKVIIHGVTYSSVEDAMLATGLSKNTIRNAQRRGAWETIGVGSGRTQKKGMPKHPVLPISLGSQTWPSKAAFARFLGLTASQVRNRLLAGQTSREIALVALKKKEKKK